MRSDTVGIIGYGSSAYEKVATRSEQSYMAEAARIALASAGLVAKDLDGVAISSTTLPPDNSVTLAEHFGMTVAWASAGNAGGAGAIVNVIDAIQAVESGRAKFVVCLAGAAQDGNFFKERIGRFNRSIGDYLTPHGFAGMNSLFALVQRKHMETFGTRREQLGRISVALRKNASMNEAALLRSPMTIDDYLNAPLIADPIRLFDCVMPCSGAEALIVGPLDRAPEGKAVRVIGSGERHNHPPGEPSPLRGGWELFREAMYAEAGTGPHGLDFLQAYDDYPIMVAIQMEDLGFCEKGEIGAFLENHELSFDGSFPLNTGGGQLSCGQTGGGGGMIGITEAVRQLRGEGGARQIADARCGMISGYGMVGYGHGLSATAMILETAA